MQTTPDIAWATGLFEGEGCISATSEKNPGPRPGPKTEKRTRIRISLAMTDEDVVRKFAKTVGCGTVIARVPKDGVRKPFWIWSVSAKKDVIRVLTMFMPWFGVRRAEKAKQAIAIALEVRDGWATRRERYGPTGHTGYKR